MDKRLALIGIIVEEPDSVQEINDLLHQYSPYIIGRMGVPYHEKGVSVISITMDAAHDIISALAGKLGSIDGVETKTIYSKK